MGKILGLDLGTNSVGWALVNLNEENLTGSIIDLGARVIPSGGKQLINYQEGKPLTDRKGNTVSECAARRKYRSSRRNIFRFKMRRDKILLVFDILGWNPVDIDYKIDREGKYPKVIVLPKKKGINKNERKGYAFEKTEIYIKYERRNRAVNGELTQEELGSVLYQLNQRRGYQDIGLLGQDEDENAKNKTERELKPNQRKVFLTISEIEEDVQIIEWTKPKKHSKKGKPIFSVKAKYDDGTIFTGTTKLGYFDKRKGKKFEFIIEEDKENNWSIISVVTKTGWTKSREENNQSLNDKTIGEKLFEYLVDLNKEGKKHWDGSLRKRTYDRVFYKKEFDAVWEKQKSIVENVSSEKIKEIAKALSPNNEAKQKNLIAKGLKWIIKEYIIYYQRPLKGGQRKEARDCPFEPDVETKNKEGKKLKIPKKSATVSHFSFQEYRIWQKINDIRIFNKEKEQQFLSEGNYEKLYSLFGKKEEITQDDILKELYKKEKENFHTNFPEEIEFKGNVTLLRIQKALSSETKEKQFEILNTPYILNQLWQIIQTVKIKEARKKAFSESKFKCIDENGNKTIFSFDIKTEKTLQALSVLEFEKGYGSLSVKAINKILPLMKRGLHFKPDEIDHKTKERIQKFIDNDETEKIGPSLFNKISGYNDFYDFQGFRYDEAAELVYGMHTRAKQDAEYKTPEEIKFIKPTELRHPVVEEVINECLKVVRDLWASEKHGKPDIIKIELARELKNNQKRRRDIYIRQTNERKRNEEAATELRSDKFNILYPTLSQIERWKLWKDQEKNVSGQSRCVYTNTYISPADLFYTTGNGSDNKKKYKFQIDHIIPQMRVFDDSYMNKVLVLGEANIEKDEYTAREFMEGGKSKSAKPYPSRMKWDDFVTFANSLPTPKRDRLLMKSEDITDDFIERQKRETQYITRRIILELSKIVGSDKIETTTGGVTNLLKQEWGLNDIFKRKLKIRYQEFEDKINNNESVRENNAQVIYIDKDETGNLKINDFTKRVDHRHHAIDALAVACTTRKHIKYLNDKNQIWQKYSDDEKQRQKYENYKSENVSFVEFIGNLFEADKNGKQKFRKPWENFCSEIVERLDNVLVSFKQKRFYHVANANKFRSKDKNGMPIIKQQKTFAIKGSMHNDLPDGLRSIFTGRHLKITKLFDILEKLSQDKWDNYFYKNFPKSIAHRLSEAARQNNNTVTLIKDAIKKHPLIDRHGKKIDELPIIEQRIASRISLIGLTEKDWKTIQNQQLKDELERHFVDNGFSKWEEAFDLEGVAMLNDNRITEGKMRIDKITVLQNAPFIDGVESANEVIERKNSFNKKSVFKKVESSFTIMYEGDSGRKFKQVKLLDYARCINEDGSAEFVEKIEGYNSHFLLDTHSLFYMPDEDEDGYLSILKNKKEEISKKLYRLNRFSSEGRDVYFLPHTTSEPLTYIFHDRTRNKDIVINEYAGSTSDSEYDRRTNRMIKKYGIPVIVDRLGNISLPNK